MAPPFSAWAAHPPGALRGAVIVGQEIFGVNSHIRAVTDRMATRGFLAIAPDLFARFTPRLDLGYSEADVAQGRRYKAQAEAMPDAILQQVQASAQWALAQAPCKVGMVGFCWGGLVTWRAAAQVPELSAAVTYYGGGMTSQRERTRRPRCPVPGASALWPARHHHPPARSAGLCPRHTIPSGPPAARANAYL